MKKMSPLLQLLVIILLSASCNNTPAPAPYGAIPTDAQIKWQEMEKYAFVHFSLNTFTDEEWGFGNVPAEIFNPTEVDCKQWVKTFKDAGLTGVIITAKHHDGFCLWPSQYTEYSVKNSAWRDGKGDLLKELSDACKEAGLKFGVYLSPWDRNHKDYGKPEYITYFRNQLTELMTNYGNIFEVWFDGANGGTGYYGGANERREVDKKNYYDWENTYKLVYKYNPNAIIFGDGGPGCRWCGTEQGWVGETNWSTLNSKDIWAGTSNHKQLLNGHEDGTDWVPAEVDVSIRPGWFYHASEDHQVKTKPHLVDIYYNSVGRNGTLLLNFPIDRRGLIHENDVANLQEMTQTIKEDFKTNLAKNIKIEASNVRANSSTYSAKKLIDGKKDTYWATDDSVTNATITLNFDKTTKINRLLIQEYIKLGQRVQEFTVSTMYDGKWKKIDKQTTIGYKRILRFPTIKVDAIKIDIKSKACPVISNIELYNAPKLLSAPTVRRDRKNNVSILIPDNEADIYYTLDGSMPDTNSLSYNKSFVLENKATVKAIAFDPITKKSSPVSTEEFDISRENWTIVNSKDKKSDLVFDGAPYTVWHKQAKSLPIDLIIDMGASHKLVGFKYLPDQNRWSSGIIDNYKFYVSQNGKKWNLVSEGEFSNIKNSPIWQIKKFEEVEARYMKFEAVSNTDGSKRAGYAEFDVITK